MDTHLRCSADIELGMSMNASGMGEMKNGTLMAYSIPKDGDVPKVYSIE